MPAYAKKFNMSETTAASPMDILAKVISAIAHPALIPFGFFLLASPKGFEYTSIFEPLLAFGILLAAPLVASFLYFRKMKITDLFVVEKKHRILPFAFNIVGLMCFSFFIPSQAVSLGYELMLLPWLGSFLVANIIAMIITLYWKISLHLMGLGLATIWLSLFLWGGPYFWPVMAGLVALTGATAWARMRLKSHDVPQVVIGWALGAAIVGIIGVVMSQM